MSKSKIFFYICLSFILGISIGSIIFIQAALLLFFSGVLLSFLKKTFVFGLCIIFLSLGILRTEQVNTRAANNDFIGLYGKNLTIKARISKEPDMREKSIKLTLDDIKINDKPIYGKILVTASRFPEHKYNSEIKVTGNLEAPPVFEDFNYRNYLLKDSIFAVMSFPKIELIEEKKNIYSWVLTFKDKLRSSIYANFSPPQSLILEGTILGDNAVLSQELKDKLNITGLRHIIAVSGTHIVVLTGILMAFLIGIGLWRGQAFYITLICITSYIAMTGFSSSGVRAGIMGAIFLLGQKLGRKDFSLRTMAIAGAVMLAINPFLIIYDIGFQLSFLAALGIIFLNPIITHWMRIIKFDFLELKSAISMTLSAQIFVLPILTFNFGNISWIAPVTNILVSPIVYLLMVFGFLSGLLGMLHVFIGWIFSLPTWFFLTYFLKITDWFSKPWFAISLTNIHWLWLIVFYLILGSYIFKKQNEKY